MLGSVQPWVLSTQHPTWHGSLGVGNCPAHMMDEERDGGEVASSVTQPVIQQSQDSNPHPPSSCCDPEHSVRLPLPPTHSHFVLLQRQRTNPNSSMSLKTCVPLLREEHKRRANVSDLSLDGLLHPFHSTRDSSPGDKPSSPTNLDMPSSNSVLPADLCLKLRARHPAMLCPPCLTRSSPTLGRF